MCFGLCASKPAIVANLITRRNLLMNCIARRNLVMNLITRRIPLMNLMMASEKNFFLCCLEFLTIEVNNSCRKTQYTFKLELQLVVCIMENLVSNKDSRPSLLCAPFAVVVISSSNGTTCSQVIEVHDAFLFDSDNETTFVVPFLCKQT